VQVTNALPTPAARDMIDAQQEYRIGPLDKLQVTVFGVPDLTTTAQVDANGNFAMPLTGPLMAAGETAESFAAKLEASLGARYIRNPQVTVLVAEAVSQQVTVDGSVVRPGQYPVIGRTTLLRTIASAGGPSEFARLQEVLVFRTVEGNRLVARFNMKDIRGGRSDDPQIFGNDVIVVGDDARRRLFRDIIQSAPLVGVFYQLVNNR